MITLKDKFRDIFQQQAEVLSLIEMKNNQPFFIFNI